MTVLSPALDWWYRWFWIGLRLSGFHQAFLQEFRDLSHLGRTLWIGLGVLFRGLRHRRQLS
jgi:hypothetical protein